MSQILDQVETLRQQALSLLMAERQLINDKIAEMGGDVVNPTTAHTNVKRQCGKCGGEGHTARTCKKAAPEGAASTIPSA